MKSKLEKPSYWRKCYDLAGVAPSSESVTNKIDPEFYWRKVMEMEDEDGNPKYWNLATLAMNILLLPHGNADQERVFSIIKGS